MGATLAEVRDDTPLAILLPSELDLGYDKPVFATGGGDRRSYFLTLTTRLPCGANSCYLASFRAKRAVKSASWHGNVRLRGGRMGLFERAHAVGLAPPRRSSGTRGATATRSPPTSPTAPTQHSDAA